MILGESIMSESFYRPSSRENPKPNSDLMTQALIPGTFESKQLTNAIYDGLLEKKEINKVIDRIITQFLSDQMRIEKEILRDRKNAASIQEKIMQENARLIETEIKKHLGSLPDRPGTRELNNLIDQLNERISLLDTKIDSLQTKIDSLQKDLDKDFKALSKIQDDSLEKLKIKLKDIKGEDPKVIAAVIKALTPSTSPTAHAMKMTALLTRALPPAGAPAPHLPTGATKPQPPAGAAPQPPAGTTVPQPPTGATIPEPPEAPEVPDAPDAPEPPESVFKQLGDVAQNYEGVLNHIKALFAALKEDNPLQQHKNVSPEAAKARSQSQLIRTVNETYSETAASGAPIYATSLQNQSRQNQARGQQSVYMASREAMVQTLEVGKKMLIDTHNKNSPSPGGHR